MAYTTISELKKRVPEAVLVRLTDDEAAGTLNTARAQEAIDGAAEEMDTYLGSKFDLPISGTVPPILNKLNADLAIYELYTRVKEEVPQTRKDRRDAAIRLLEKIVSGEISIGLQPAPTAPGADDYQGGSRVDVRTKDFDATTMDKY